MKDILLKNLMMNQFLVNFMILLVFIFNIISHPIPKKESIPGYMLKERIIDQAVLK